MRKRYVKTIKTFSNSLKRVRLNKSREMRFKGSNKKLWSRNNWPRPKLRRSSRKKQRALIRTHKVVKGGCQYLKGIGIQNSQDQGPKVWTHSPSAIKVNQDRITYWKHQTR